MALHLHLHCVQLHHEGYLAIIRTQPLPHRVTKRKLRSSICERILASLVTGLRHQPYRWSQQFGAHGSGASPNLHRWRGRDEDVDMDRLHGWHDQHNDIGHTDRGESCDGHIVRISAPVITNCTDCCSAMLLSALVSPSVLQCQWSSAFLGDHSPAR